MRKPAKSAPGGLVLGPTRCEIGGKVRLVVIVKECEFSQLPHQKHLTKSLPSLTLAPGAKTRQKCAWWAGFGPHQVRKLGKSAPGGYVASNLLWVFPFRGPVRTEGRCELKRKGCCSNNVRGSSLVSFRRPLPPKEREAFYVSRGFPFLMVAASYSDSLLKMQQPFSNSLATL